MKFASVIIGVLKQQASTFMIDFHLMFNLKHEIFMKFCIA